MKKLNLLTAVAVLSTASLASYPLIAEKMPTRPAHQDRASMEIKLAQAEPEAMPMDMSKDEAESGEAVQSRGIVEQVDEEKRQVTLAHEPIPEWSWPQMTMSFEVAEGIDMSELETGSEVEFTAIRTEEGGQRVTEITPAGHDLQVYKSPTCGCCEGWVDYIREHGLSAAVHHPQDLDAEKERLGIKPVNQSCHTAVSRDGYVFEGHVPAKFVEQFMAQKPEDAIGLAVPGMPLGSPGMEVNDRFTPYDILLLKKNGSSEVYASVESMEDQ